jgi:hypothetical protein
VQHGEHSGVDGLLFRSGNVEQCARLLERPRVNALDLLLVPTPNGADNLLCTLRRIVVEQSRRNSDTALNARASDFPASMS